ncbi:MAG: hypothetical protein M3P16_06940, partial [Chloroflexota bacterium]|nr:hypothetical protein [Chloroflexota bacterium]
FSGSLTRAAGENVGTYAIAKGTVTLGTNYTLSYVGANLVIGARPVTITADAKSKTYGASDPALTYAITTGSLVGTDAFSGSLTRAAGENVGTYAIAKGTVTLGTNYTLSYVGANLVITTATAKLMFTGQTLWPTNTSSASVTLTAQVGPPADPTLSFTDWTKAKVKFLLWNSSGTLLTVGCSASANVSGVAQCSVTLPIDSFTVQVVYDTGSYYSGDPDTGVVTVYQPGQSVTGGGWIADPWTGSSAPVPTAAISPTNKHGNYGFNVQYDKNGNLKGQSVFVYRGADGLTYLFKSNSWSGGWLAVPSSTNASFLNSCNLQVMDATGNLVRSQGNLTCRVDLTDNGEPGTSDRYAFTATSGSAVIHQIGDVTNQIQLGGGNIKIQTTK